MSENVQTMKADEILRKFTRELPVALQDHELQTYGKMLAEKCKEQELAIDKKKQVTADHNNRIKVITNEIKRIADARAKGEELRPVMCGERLKGNVIEIVRLDSGVVVDSRPAEMRDLQTTMPGVPEMPDGFDPGPRGDGLGSLADQPEGAGGEMVESSTGGQVFVADEEDDDESDEDDEKPQLAIVRDDDMCDACGTAVKDGERTIEHEGSTIHADCAPDGKVETEDEMIDRKLAEREASSGNGAADEDFGGAVKRAEVERANKEAEKAEAAKKKPKRERSAQKNGKRKK